MGRLSRAAGRGVARLVPAERRDWAEAVWAEVGEVPSALGRLAWVAGGAWLIARESLMVRRVRNTILFALAAAYLAWTALPGTPSAIITAYIWLRTIGTIAVLAGLPWLMRRRMGPVIDNRLARSLRVATFAGLMALIVAMAEFNHINDTPARLAAAGPHNQPSISMLLPWSAFLLLLAGYTAVILAVTAQRSWVMPSTLSIGAGTGIALGVVMYAIMPLGVSNDATAPWLRGSAIDPVVVIAWVLLFGGPLGAALLAGSRCRGPAGPLIPAEAKIRQGVAAGTLATVSGSLLVCILGPVTMALMPSAGWLVHLLYPGRHLSAEAVVSLVSSFFPAGYFLIWLAFPLIGLGIGSLTALVAWGDQAVRQRDQGPDEGGRGGPGPEPGPPSGDDPWGAEHEPSSVAIGVYAGTRGS
jgi:hypothetical protein